LGKVVEFNGSEIDIQTNFFLNFLPLTFLWVLNKTDYVTKPACSSSTSRTMLERFTILWRVKVNNTMNAFDIKTSCRNIRCYNCMSFTLTEIINCSRTHFLSHSTMYASYT